MKKHSVFQEQMKVNIYLKNQITQGSGLLLSGRTRFSLRCVRDPPLTRKMFETFSPGGADKCCSPWSHNLATHQNYDNSSQLILRIKLTRRQFQWKEIAHFSRKILISQSANTVKGRARQLHTKKEACGTVCTGGARNFYRGGYCWRGR